MASPGPQESSREREIDIVNQRKPSLASWPSSESRSSESSAGGPNGPGDIPIPSPQVSSPPSSVDASPQGGIEQESQKNPFGLKPAPSTSNARESDIDSARTPTKSFSNSLTEAQGHDGRFGQANDNARIASVVKEHDAARSFASNLWQTDELLSPVASISPSLGGAPFFSHSEQERNHLRRQTSGSSASKDLSSSSGPQANSPGTTSGTVTSGSASLLSRTAASPPASSPGSLNSQALPYTPSSFPPPPKSHSFLKTQPGSGPIASGTYGIVRGVLDSTGETEPPRRYSVSSSHRTSAFQPLSVVQEDQLGAFTGYSGRERAEAEGDPLPDLPSFSSPSSSSSLNSAAAAFSPSSKLHSGSHSAQLSGFPFGGLSARKGSLPIANQGEYSQNQENAQSSHVEQPVSATTSVGLSDVALPSQSSGRIARSQVSALLPVTSMIAC